MLIMPQLKVLQKLKDSSPSLFKWLSNNYMKHKLELEFQNAEELLGIDINAALTFENHSNKICKKVSQKLNALARISPYMPLKREER